MIDVVSIDHIVLAVSDVDKVSKFYEQILGIKATKSEAGKVSLNFGSQKINLQPANNLPQIASNTKIGSGNFCLLTQTPMEEVVSHLNRCNVNIIEGPAIKDGAAGDLLSVYFRDVDGNLVEIANQLHLQ